MSLKVTKATMQHIAYFKQKDLENGACYVVSDENSVCGLFTFSFISDKEATLNFPFCLNKEAIALAFTTFKDEYPLIEKITSLSRQNLAFIGFEGKEYIVHG